jgi:Family of unknown function (DUF5906)
VQHVNAVYPDESGHIINYLAHRRQKPGEKINHALVLGGAPGIGKDSLLEPAKYAVGPWNFSETSPKNILGRFNGFLKCVILRISEARDLGDFDRFDFYEAMKIYTAAPPDVLRVDEKNLREHAVVNCCGVIITTNHKTDGIHIPADDRRHFVAWSERTQADFDAGYWNGLWQWYQNGGISHVAAYLSEHNISEFDPKAPPQKTEAFWAIADSGRSPEEMELRDIIESLGNPDAFTLDEIVSEAVGTEIGIWLAERKNRRTIPHRLESCEYVAFRNPGTKDGRWKVYGKNQTIYVKTSLPQPERWQAARKLCP